MVLIIPTFLFKKEGNYDDIHNFSIYTLASEYHKNVYLSSCQNHYNIYVFHKNLSLS